MLYRKIEKYIVSHLLSEANIILKSAQVIHQRRRHLDQHILWNKHQGCDG